MKCPACKQEMKNGVGCTLVRYDGDTEDRIPYEDEGQEHNCHDCDCPPGKFHHPGCDMERCPNCGGQLISCDCNYE